MPLYVLQLSQEELNALIDQRVQERIKEEMTDLKQKISAVKRDVLNSKEAAEYLKVSSKTLYNYITNGKNGKVLPYEGSGKARFFRLQDLINFNQP